MLKDRITYCSYTTSSTCTRGGFTPDAGHPYPLQSLFLLFFVAPLPMQLPEQRMNSFFMY
jgi:hypothetical protein